MKLFNDPIHGYIEIPGCIVKIIDTPHFQRLRNVAQLGPTKYVFHGATHTRFEHSIGVCWLAGQWARHLQLKQPGVLITDRDIINIQIAGLVHDIGHGCLSHTFEKYLDLCSVIKSEKSTDFSHEQMSVDIFEDIWSCTDIPGISLEDVIEIEKIILGTSTNVLAQIVCNKKNGLDADKLDYFARDSQCTSFKISCDWKRLVYESRIIDGNMCFPIKMVDDVWNVYQTRFKLFKNVYFHPTVQKVESMILTAMYIADKAGVFRYKNSYGNYVGLADSINDVTSFIKTNDDIIGQMERCDIPEVLTILNNLRTRKLYFTDLIKFECVRNKCHYGANEANPLLSVDFFKDFSGHFELSNCSKCSESSKCFENSLKIVTVERSLINSLCPVKFNLLI